MRFILGVAILAAPTGLAAQTPRTSWGKAGVAIDRYRDDAVTCGRAGLATDINDMQAVKTLITASRQLDSVLDNQVTTSTVANASGQLDPVALNTAQLVSRITQGANPRARFREVRQALQGTVDQCLTDRGYVRFTLTRAQRTRLEDLKRGSPERHAYLHALASDPAVLARQRATVEVLPVEPVTGATPPN